MKLLYIVSFAFLGQSSFSYATESVERKGPDLRHLALGCGKLAKGIAAGYAGYALLTARDPHPVLKQFSFFRGSFELGLMKISECKKNKSPFRELPFVKDSGKIEPRLLITPAMLYCSYRCFCASYNSFLSSKDSFIKAFSTEEVKEDHVAQEEDTSTSN